MVKYFTILLIISCTGFAACHQAATTEEDTGATETVVKTPVTVTSVSFEPLVDFIELNATSAYLQQNIIKSSANGYIKFVGLQKGQFVHPGQLAFTLRTKESEALGNTINALDSSFHFSGLIRIRTNHSGYVAQLDHQAGDYVQDGEQLAVLSDSKSFGFLLNLPYELRPLLASNKTMEVILPDGTHLQGIVASVLPVVDSVSQTQAISIKVNSSYPLPQSLIAKVRLIKAAKNNVATLPKEAVLTDEAQSNFWIMKVIDSVTAIKVPVIKGMESNNRIEIVSPRLSSADKIVLNGNYGLPDTAKIIITAGAR